MVRFPRRSCPSSSLRHKKYPFLFFTFLIFYSFFTRGKIKYTWIVLANLFLSRLLSWLFRGRWDSFHRHPLNHITAMFEGFQESFKWVLMMSRGTSFTDAWSVLIFRSRPRNIQTRETKTHQPTWGSRLKLIWKIHIWCQISRHNGAQLRPPPPCW